MSEISGQGSNPAIKAVNDYFKTDVGKAVSKPDKPQSEAILKSGFTGSAKISTVSHHKLEEGKLSQDQDAIVSTLLDAVSRIGGSTSKGTLTSNSKVADKIAQRVLKEYGGNKKAAQRDLGVYAQKIRSAQLERVFSQTTSGPVSKASLRSEGLMKEQWAENISEGFIVGKERNLNKISVDIDRYSSLDRLSFQDSEGNAIDIKGLNEFQETGGNFKDYVGKEMLPKMMIGVGWTEKGTDGQIKLTGRLN